jgi:hypothetical protein
MIHEEICTYEVCKLAKDKGFNVDCQAFYYDDGFLQYAKFENWNGRYINKFSAPTHGLLQRWLREEKGIVVEVIAQPTCSTSKKNCYWWSVKQNSDGFCYQYEECSYLLYSDEGYFDTYELALEDVIKYALENLV